MSEKLVAHERYLLFVGDFFYPAGGFSDFVGSYKSIESAERYGCGSDWYQIVDSESYEIVKESRLPDEGI